ncbi:MAG: CinA family protein [Bauldia sp.]|nr:CinA family protein [Bauldia sp.]
MPDLSDLRAEAEALVRRCQAAGLRIATAESCTGGLVAAAITGINDASAVFDRGFVTYANEAKMEMLGVPAALIAEHGAVSEPVAIAMAEGALAHAPVDIAVAITGIAGPGGGTPEKPVGLVHFATARKGAPTRHMVHIFEDLGRDTIRHAATRQALLLLMEMAASG